MSVKASNDHDFVPPDRYKPLKGPIPAEITQLEKVPEFNSMVLDIKEARVRLPSNVDSSNPEALFRLFFTDELLRLIVNCTNACAERQRDDLINPSPQALNRKPWRPVIEEDILAYLGIFISFMLSRSRRCTGILILLTGQFITISASQCLRLVGGRSKDTSISGSHRCHKIRRKSIHTRR